MLFKPLAEFWVVFSGDLYGNRLVRNRHCPERGTTPGLDHGCIDLLRRFLDATRLPGTGHVDGLKLIGTGSFGWQGGKGFLGNFDDIRLLGKCGQFTPLTPSNPMGGSDDFNDLKRQVFQNNAALTQLYTPRATNKTPKNNKFIVKNMSTASLSARKNSSRL